MLRKRKFSISRGHEGIIANPGRVPWLLTVRKKASLVNPKSSSMSKQIVSNWLDLFKAAKTRERKAYCYAQINYYVAHSWGVPLSWGKVFKKSMMPKA
ncbi:MAG: hypothetical protein ABIH20_01130 [Candidatus Diapherotrites archaeon]